MTVDLRHGDCLDVLRELADDSVDSVVCDPPYNLSFMGKTWDSHVTPMGFQLWCMQWADECLRVLKPGGHLLAFGGTRTWHRLACAIEDAGFEMRDSIAWLYGSGFPKSLDVSKSIDKAAGAEREVVGRHVQSVQDRKPGTSLKGSEDASLAWQYDLTAPATDAARQWQGWGTALKPAFEPVVVARKPLVGTVAQNVLAYGTGAINVDAGRIGAGEPVPGGGGGKNSARRNGIMGETGPGNLTEPHTSGRWPANVALDADQAAALDQMSGITKSNDPGTTHVKAEGWGHSAERRNTGYAGDVGGASRFFLTAEPDAPDLPIDELAKRFIYCAKAPKSERPVVDGVSHPTVKPLSLLRWLVRLVTAPGGTVLEPFAGSGTTVEAAILEGFDVIAIEREADYLPLIQARIFRAQAKGAAAAEPVESPKKAKGRWPANVVLDEESAEALDVQSGNRPGAVSNGSKTKDGLAGSNTFKIREREQAPGYADQGGASRFFFVAQHDEPYQPDLFDEETA